MTIEYLRKAESDVTATARLNEDGVDRRGRERRRAGERGG